MKKTRKALLGILLSLAMAVSCLTGISAQLHPVFAESDAETTVKEKKIPYTYGAVKNMGADVNPGVLAAPEDGYTFAGWFADAGCTVGANFASANSDATVYAKWIKVLNGEEEEEEESESESEDEENQDSEEDYSNSSDSTDSQYNDYLNDGGDQSGYSDPNAADFNEVPENVEGEDEEVTGTEGGEGEEVTGQEGGEVTAPEDGEVTGQEGEEAPAPEGEEDEEVTGQEAGDVGEAPAPEAGETEEVTAPEEEAAEADADEPAEDAEKDEAKEAKADENLQEAGTKYKVTFDVQGHGTAPKTQEVESGKKAEEPDPPTAEGYIFGGWFTDKECKTAYDFSETVTKDVTVYAKWTVITYTVSFKTSRGTAPAAQTVNHGEKAAKPADPTAKGYTFTGWQKADGTAYDFSAPVKSNLELTAGWRPNKYTIHFDPNGGKGTVADVAATYDVEAVLTKNSFTRGADWEFIGWNTAANRSGTAYVDQAKVKNLTDADGATVTLYAQWRFIYRMISGAGASVSKLDTRGLTFQTNGFYNLFTGVAVDGAVINANNYTSSAGNYGTFVTLKQDFIKTLSIGQHTIQFLYSDGSVSCVFYVNNSTILNPPQTGDSSNSALWISLLVGAAVVAAGFGLLKRKFKF